MSKLIEFTKIEATGNDFIFIDARKFSESMFSASIIKEMCDRHFGIGADGLIFIDNHQEGAFSMNYYNSDGLPANMCANGGRSAVLFAAVSGIIDCEEDVHFMAADGRHQAKIHSANDIEIEILYRPPNEKTDLSTLTLPEKMTTEGSVNTGVPHLVVSYNGDLENVDVNTLGRNLRFDPLFGQEGTNVNFIKIESDDEISIRSYERGIEAETLSCGTGVAAAALIFMQKNSNKLNKVTVNSKGGKLFVSFSNGKLYLRGPVNIVYVGNLYLD